MPRLKKDHVLQLKVTLRRIKPPVWRRILVPSSYTFWDLHVAIQDAMGWMDGHLHDFYLKPKWSSRPLSIGIPSDEDEDPGIDSMLSNPALQGLHPAVAANILAESNYPERLAGWDVPVVRFLTLEQRKILYCYDFGDGWEHDILLEKVLPIERGTKLELPQCTAGRRACPPEDCGGEPGYLNLLEVLADPKHEEHESMLEWVGGHYDPAAFDPADVTFDDPRERWENAFRWP